MRLSSKYGLRGDDAKQQNTNDSLVWASLSKESGICRRPCHIRDTNDSLVWVSLSENGGNCRIPCHKRDTNDSLVRVSLSEEAHNCGRPRRKRTNNFIYSGATLTEEEWVMTSVKGGWQQRKPCHKRDNSITQAVASRIHTFRETTMTELWVATWGYLITRGMASMKI